MVSAAMLRRDARRERQRTAADQLEAHLLRARADVNDYQQTQAALAHWTGLTVADVALAVATLKIRGRLVTSGPDAVAEPLRYRLVNQ